MAGSSSSSTSTFIPQSTIFIPTKSPIIIYLFILLQQTETSMKSGSLYDYFRQDFPNVIAPGLSSHFLADRRMHTLDP